MQIEKQDFPDFIARYEEDEEIYRKIDELRRNAPEKLNAYIDSVGRDKILHLRLFIPELCNNTWYPYLGEEAIFSDLPGDIVILKHFRYTPVFQHAHGFFEVLCIYSGTAKITIQDKEKTLTRGDICIIPPGTAHSIGIFDDSVAINIIVRASTFQTTFFPIFMDTNPLSQFFLHVLLRKTEGNYLIFHTAADELIRSLLEDMFIEYRGHQKYSDSILSTMLIFFWAQLLRRHEQNIESFLSEAHGSVPMSEILDYLTANFKTVTLTEAAAHFHFSTAHLSRFIKEGTGSSFVQIIKGIKLRQAKRALRETKLSIAAICEVVGYENTEHFMRVFKKEYGMTPGDYRRSETASHNGVQ